MFTSVYGDGEDIIINSAGVNRIIHCTNAIITFTDGTVIHIERNKHSHLWFIHYMKHCKAESCVDVCGVDIDRTSDIFYTKAIIRTIQNIETVSQI